jgi:hypothetical protein
MDASVSTPVTKIFFPSRIPIFFRSLLVVLFRYCVSE